MTSSGAACSPVRSHSSAAASSAPAVSAFPVLALERFLTLRCSESLATVDVLQACTLVGQSALEDTTGNTGGLLWII